MKPLTLFLIRRTDLPRSYRPHGDWRSLVGAVVAAHDRAEARRLIVEGGHAGEEGPEVWFDGLKTRCVVIGTSSYTRPQVVLTDLRG